MVIFLSNMGIFLLNHGDFPASYVSLPEGLFLGEIFVPMIRPH